MRKCSQNEHMDENAEWRWRKLETAGNSSAAGCETSAMEEAFEHDLPWDDESI